MDKICCLQRNKIEEIYEAEQFNSKSDMLTSFLKDFFGWNNKLLIGRNLKKDADKDWRYDLNK